MGDTPSRADVTAGVLAALHAYVQALDDGRTEDVVGTYVADGVFDAGDLGVTEGREALGATYAGWVPVVPQRHVMANTVVTEWTGDRATAVSDVIFMVRPGDTWVVQLVGRYVDTLRREGDDWRFEKRVLRFLE